MSWTKKTRHARTLLVIVVLVVIVFCLLAAWQLYDQRGRQVVKTDRFQAVFIDGGQVFFGKLKNTTGEYLTLESPYYTKSASASSSTDTTLEQSTGLVKVGSESYGPDNSLSLRADHVLFWQNLRENSKVAEAIRAKADE